MKNSQNSNLVFAFLAGALAGLAVGVLVAPDKGSDTRDKIMSKAKEGFDFAKDYAVDTYNNAKGMVTDNYDQAKSGYDSAKSQFDSIKSNFESKV